MRSYVSQPMMRKSQQPSANGLTTRAARIIGPLRTSWLACPSPTQSSVQVLIETLDHRDPDIRWAVALILIRLAKTDKRVLQLLIELASKGTAESEANGDLLSTRCGIE